MTRFVVMVQRPGDGRASAGAIMTEDRTPRPVPQGRLTPAYGGGGGGRDLQRAGATHATLLRPGQARVMLAALIAKIYATPKPIIERVSNLIK